MISISSSDPDIEKYVSFGFPTASETGLGAAVFKSVPDDSFKGSFSFAAPGKAAAGTGRSFVSTSNFNPFSLPLFIMPINLEGLGLGNFGSLNNWLKNIESIHEPNLSGNGEIRTVTAVNDNGHVYGNVKTVTFDNNEVKTNIDIRNKG